MTVTNSDGRLVGGLTRDDFAIFDEKVIRPVVAFDNADEPLDVCILVDISGSMNATPVRKNGGQKQIVESLSTFVHLSNKKNRYVLMVFREQYQMLSDWNTDIGPALTQIPVADGKGHTAFYDALLAAIEKVKTGTHRKRVVLVVSDGWDSGSRLKPDQIRKALRANNVLTYFLAPAALPGTIGSISGLPMPVFNLPNITGGPTTLMEFGRITGGRAMIVEQSGQMITMANQIATELRHQYRVEFEPLSVSPGKWRRLEVRIKPRADAGKEFRNLKLRVKQGYYSGAHGKQ